MAYKWVAPFRRREWQLCDYPIGTRGSGGDVNRKGKWLAQILNWPGPMGVGASEKKAVANLRQNFENIRANRSANQERMPRPGKKVPVQFAPTVRVLADPALHDDFIIRVLGFKPGSPVFISDQSSLSDFGDESRIAELRTKIAEVYGVDVSDLREGLLCDILERIQNRA